MAKPFGWNVADPSEIAFGKSYGAWLEEWEKWLISDYPDRTNNGPVYFTRGVNCEIPYNRLVRTGDKRLIMSTMDAIFHVVIAWMNTSNTDTHLPNSSSRTNDAIASALNFEPRPNNAKILKRDPEGGIEDENIISSYRKFLTVTREFAITVPEVGYESESGDKEECKNLNQFLDHPVVSGDNLTVAAAYCFFIQPTQIGNYYLASTGSAENNYTTTTFLEIEVVKDKTEVQSKIIEELATKRSPTFNATEKVGNAPVIGDSGRIKEIINELFK